jgi:PAS domain S-box-containing protein
LRQCIFTEYPARHVKQSNIQSIGFMRADQQLKASLKEIGDLKAALDEHAIVAITDPQGKITYVNDKFCAISKFSRKELLGQDHRIINSSFHPKEFIRDLWTTITHGKVWKGEIKNRAKDGSFYWVDTTIVPFLSDDGKPRQYVAIRADITERKAAEEKLRESEERLRTMISSVRDYAIIMLDIQGCVMDWNLGAKTIKGWRAEEIIGRHFSCFYTPEDVAAHQPERRLQQAANEGRAEDEGWRVRKDGSRFWANVVITALRNPDGQLRGFVKVTCDLTDRKRAEDKLKASLKEIGDLKAALDEHAIVAITDPQGKITYVNDKFCAISRFSRRELLGQDHRIINSSFHPKEFIRDLWTTITHGKVWKGEIKNRAKDGSFYWVDTTIVPFLSDDGKPRQYVAIRADITERKAAEEKIRQLNVELEQRVSDRTAELEAFSYSVSHDLRAPVRAIGGFARMVQQDYGAQIPAEACRKLGRIHENAMKMGQLIDGLLTFSRLGRQSLNRRKVLPSPIVQRVLEELQAEQTNRRVEIAAADLPACQADPTLLQQVFANLISNAFKYTRQRDPAVIQIGSRDEKGQCVYFIKDNGAGFEMKYAHKLFGVFQRLHGADQFEGTGVGLAIVQRIIHRHGGRVWAEAELEKGAIFSFTLGNGNSHV